MAREVARLYRSSNASDLRVIVMGGHEDGVLSFGRTPDEAVLAMMRALTRANALGRD